MAKKKIKSDDEEVIDKKKAPAKDSSDEVPAVEEGAIDPSIIEDTFAEEFSEYNDVDNF